ncbi:hypothetical protein [Streptomyces sp. NPDC050504]|uniref:hypothetical protein n=1 Tax=Streptomyces sp. NPDC050504 TaxID=3365618 RepID=UPI003789673A
MTTADGLSGLHVDFGVDHRGYRVRPPRARYVCTACGTTEGPVYGHDQVRALVARVMTDHPTYCTARTETSHDH